MGSDISYGDFVREATIQQKQISYDLVTPRPEYDEEGKEIPHSPQKFQLRGIDIYRLLSPYISVRLKSQIKAVVPLALYLIFFQLVILRQSVLDHWTITAGLLAVIIGLMIFMEGLKLGLMPFAEIIGDHLPKKSSLKLVLFIAFLLGIGVTFAEPAIGALQAVGSIVDIVKAPYLYTLLNDWTDQLILVVGIGVGLAAMLGTMRFLHGWSLKPMIYLTLIPALGLTTYCMTDDELAKIIGLAWDCGAVTTGPVTVPLVLALGIGIASAAGKGSSSLSGFGIVTLASLFPIIGVMMLAIYISSTVSVESIIQAAQAVSTVSQTAVPWYEQTPIAEIILGTRAIVPLVIFLFFVLKVIIREDLHDAGIVTYGLTLSVVGMILFSIGLSYGLAKLGSQSGSFVPSAFAQIENVQNSPLYSYSIGISVALLFASVLGFGATLAEPALNALGETVESLTNGAFKKSTLMYAVSVGVGIGITIGVVKIIYNIPLAYILIPAYTVAVMLTAISSEEFVDVAWDSAGVTTGPITVPLVLAMGLGFGNAIDTIEGFGILSMASICPILSVLITGIIITARIKRIKRNSEEKTKIAGVVAA